MAEILGQTGDRSADPGSREWALAVRLDIQANLHQWDDDVKNVKAFIELMVRHEGWRKLEDRRRRPFDSFADFCKEREPYGLGHDPELIDAIQVAKNGTTVGVATSKLRDKPGRPTLAELSNPDNIINTPPAQQGTSREYTLARLERDTPELAARVRDGEISAHAAAIEAGFRKRPTPINQLRSAWKRASKSERKAFLNEVG